MSTQTIEAENETLAADGTTIPPGYNLAIYGPFTAPQRVMDGAGNGSALYVGPGRVGIGTPTPEYRLSVEGDHTLAQLRSLSGEASLQFTNAVDNVRWAIGSGGIESAPNAPAFFLWNDKTTTFSFVATPTALKLNQVHMPDLALPPADAQLKGVVVDTRTGKLYRQP
jgi:hypothetical protein